MMIYRQTQNYENLQKRIFEGVGEYGIPEIKPTQYEECDLIPFNYAKSEKERESKGIHFFIDDYQFNRLWTNIDQYIKMLQQFKCVFSPDFSTYTDFPKAIQIYNHYRKHWIGAYMQDHGVNVIPTISWSTPDSFKWCFDGEPEGGCVAVSSVGCMNSKASKELFMTGYNEMLRRLKPNQIIFYGQVPDEYAGSVIQVNAYSNKFRKDE